VRRNVPERDSGSQPSAEGQLRALYDNAESTAARAFEQAVATPSFGALLARSAENVAALSRMGSDLADGVLRNLRVAGRSDITRLAKQLHRTEDKLERVLQEIELLRDELARSEAEGPNGRASAGSDRSAPTRTSAGSGRSAPSRASAGSGRSAPSRASGGNGRTNAGNGSGSGSNSGNGSGTRTGSTGSRSRTT
jgi:hypothetical protein